VFEWCGAVWKTKRCGFAEEGFRNEPFFSPSFHIRDKELIEFHAQSFGGLMPLDAAIAEVLWCREAENRGLCSAYRAIGTLALVEMEEHPFPTRSFGAALFEVTSDLRVDELVAMALSPLIVELLASGRMTIGEFNGFHGAVGIPVNATLAETKPTKLLLLDLGRAVGGLYRRTHDSGLLRGLGSAWFGNEVIGADGYLSLVDFDGGMISMSDLAQGTAECLAALEVEAYCSESMQFLTDMKPVVFGILAQAFVGGFRDGYHSAAEPYIDLERVCAVVGAHLQVRDRLAAVYDLDYPDPS
jgi:hypothetical protein